MKKGSHKKLKAALLIIFLTVLLIGLTSWLVLSKILDKVSFEKQNTLNYKEAGAEISLNKESIPNGFPRDFPIYPNAKITSAWKSGEDKVQGFSLVLESSDKLESISSFYDSELASAGWNIENTSGSIQTKEINSVTLSFNKDASKGFIGLVENGGRVIISLSLGVTK